MDKNTLEFVKAKTQEIIKAPQCCAELKAAAEVWLNGSATNEETEKYVAELMEDIMPLDQLIAFSGSEAGEKIFGSDFAKKLNEHGKELKAQGAKYCDCAACAPAGEILKALGRI